MRTAVKASLRAPSLLLRALDFPRNLVRVRLVPAPGPAPSAAALSHAPLLQLQAPGTLPLGATWLPA